MSSLKSDGLTGLKGLTREYPVNHENTIGDTVTNYLTNYSVIGL